MPWESFTADYDLIRDSIARVIPGFDNFNARVRHKDGFTLPHPPRDTRTFDTTTDKANFAVNKLAWLPVPQGRLILQTMRSHDQYNTTIYGLDDRYRGVKGGRRVVFANAADIADLGFINGDIVDLVSEWTRPDGSVEERRADAFRLVDYPTPRRKRRRLLPRNQPPHPTRPRRHHIQHPGVQGSFHPTRTPHSVTALG